MAAGTTARASSPGLRVACPQKSFSVAFFPKGETGERRPHVRVTATGQVLALVFPKRLSFGPACKAVKDLKAAWGGGPSKTVRKRFRIRCSVTGKVELRGGPFVGSAGTYAGNKLFATRGRTRDGFLLATMKAKSSSLRYDTRYCKKQ